MQLLELELKGIKVFYKKVFNYLGIDTYLKKIVTVSFLNEIGTQTPKIQVCNLV